MSASFVSAMNTRANHFAIDQENHLNILNKQLKELAMFVDLKDRLLDHLYDHANDIQRMMLENLSGLVKKMKKVSLITTHLK